MTPFLSRPLLRLSWQSWISSDLRPPVGPRWLQWLWTSLFAAGLAGVFTLLAFVAFARNAGDWLDPWNWGSWYGRNLIVCFTIAATIHGLFDAARWLLRGRPPVSAWAPWQRSLLFGGVPILGLVLGWPVGMALAGMNLLAWLGQANGSRTVAGSVVLSVLISFAMHHWFAAKARQAEAERRATEAQLKLLQGQIEPHFLFNTLAGVVSLIEVDPPQARRLLQAFTDYLRSALGALRSEAAPLDDELGLVQQFLVLMQARMEDRLRWRIDASAEARAVQLPPLLVQPLVENAIRHGLEPSLDGGELVVTARRAADRLTIEVRDTGVGPDPDHPRRRPGQGLALANLRERLAARYGDAARFSVAAATPGTLARIELPLDGLAPSDTRAAMA